MSAANDGGPAYPTQNGCRNDPGMSKREVIAKDAIAGYLAGRNNSERTHLPGDTHHTDVAKVCLRYADALLAEFAKEPEAETPPEVSSANTLLQDMEVIHTIAGPPHHPDALSSIHAIAAAAIAKAKEDADRESDLLEMLERCEMWLSTKPDGRAMQLACQEAIIQAIGEGYPVPLYVRDTLRLERNLLAAALENYLTTETLEDLERLANSTTLGLCVAKHAQAQLQLRGALGMMTANGE